MLNGSPVARLRRTGSRGLFSLRWIAAVALACVACDRAPGGIIGDVVGVGYPSVGGGFGGRDLVRTGNWAPVIVDLALQGEAAFDGWLRVSQPDKDGDLVYDLQKVQLLADTGGVRRYWLYMIANPPAGGASYPSVELLTDDFRRAEIVSGGEKHWVTKPREAPVELGDQDYLVLSVSSLTVGKLGLLPSAEHAERFAKTIHVAHIQPSRVPRRWAGLEAVDAVVWDEADATELAKEQIHALLEWTRQGGHVVIAAGRTADTLRQESRLSNALPVELGAVTQTARLDNVRRVLLGAAEQVSVQPIPIVQCELREGASVVAEERSATAAAEGNYSGIVIARTTLGRGRVTYIAASLRDLFREGGDEEKFFHRVLELRSPVFFGGGTPVPLFQHIDGQVGFSQVGVFYLGLAVVFAMGYVLLATFGVWRFLDERGWLRHSWTAFAVVALVASAAAIAGVQSVRGVGKRMQQLTVVDARANEGVGQATAYFGLRTSVFGTLDVWLPQAYPELAEPELSHCFLKPLPSSKLAGAKTYADPGRYRMLPSTAELRQAPIRGTVKQFEGRWRGSLRGQLRADLRRVPGPERGETRIAPSGTIVNELGVDFDKTYLVYATEPTFVPGSGVDQPRADGMYVFPLGPLADGASIMPGQQMYVDEQGVELGFKDWTSQRVLETHLRRWGDYFERLSLQQLRQAAQLGGDLQPHEAALMLLTFLEEFVPEQGGGLRPLGGVSFSAAHCRELDISPLIDQQTALFIGFARDAGPASLCVRDSEGEVYERVTPGEALTMYRVLIPLSR